ncbi:MAG: 30S ribosomal protein S27e [Candidatus Micrarchaeota archaeon]
MGKFLLVKCDCGEEAVVYGDSKSRVNCKKCGSPMAEPKGGRAKITARILEVLQ